MVVLSKAMSITINFRDVAFPPLLSKWGGVAHPRAIHGGSGAAWDTITNATLEELAEDAKRRTPAVLGVIELGHTMSNVTRPIFSGDASKSDVKPILDPLRLALRRLRGQVQPMLLFSGRPTPVFRINTSTIPSPHARFYPMCAYEQLDLLAASFAKYARALHEQDGLSSSWSFWAEPAHTISATSSRQDKLANIERYLDFYERVAPAIRASVPDDVIAGWQLNAANGKLDDWVNGSQNHPPDMFYEATQRFLARERAGGARLPLDYFTMQNYRGEESASLVAHARTALCATQAEKPSNAACSARFALTPVFFVRFSEHKDVDPDFTRKSGTSELLDELALTADLPDVAYVVHSAWEEFFSGNASLVLPMLPTALAFVRALPTFRVPLTLPASQRGNLDVRGLAALNETTQCFMLWSRSNVAGQMDMSIDLRDRPPSSSAQVVQLYTLGPKHASWIPEREAPLPPPPTTHLIINDVYFKPYGVIAGCVDRDSGAAAPPKAIESLGGAIYARHDVLVPRGPDPNVAPAGLGHYDIWSSTLVVAIGSGIDLSGKRAKAGEAVGLAGVLLRAVPATSSFALVMALALHAPVMDSMGNAIAAAVRVDYLDGDSPISSLLFASAGADPQVLWGGVAAAWPHAARTNSSSALLPAFDATGHTNFTLPLGASAPGGWAAADSGARRVRISLVLRHQHYWSTGAATLRAQLSAA